MEPQRRILVTGARAKTGDPLARLLVARPGVEVLGGSRDPATVDLPGVVPTAISWDEPTTWGSAIGDVDAVFVVRPDRPDAPELIAGLLGQAPEDAHVVLLSERAADYAALDRWGLRCEDAVRSGPRSWTILRPSWFMQVLTDPRFFRDAVTGDAELPFPDGGGRLAWIDARDIAAVAEVALLDSDHRGSVLELTGPEALTLEETAGLLSPLAGRPVTHRRQTVAEAVVGMDGFDLELTEMTYERVRAGAFAEVTGEVERVTGRPPRSLATFVEDVVAGLDGPPTLS
ncbi:nucleoside-diphosphate sugar epimerase [Nocardioides sp. zg-1308]|uniref:nucleoside-diphosphate sugar epimerase n=1 Tax=Nocardioides sp. zg-1308 TaxID=2736253 RepID=UPI0015537E01|nr:nucleoside-diphosphate sugar epimerase [Nocardioides sp. zg-1308]NPD03589.1 nucleoside-diphosphate sugar epimerase [Nocardioides sp. zg-1308]